MNTYNTYQEAKIANPESEIYAGSCKFKVITGSPTNHFANGWKVCNPADYCMTVEQFLDDGHKFVDGGLYIGANGEVIVVGETISAAVANLGRSGDNNRLVLRAAALNQTETPEEKEAFDVMEKDNEAVEWDGVGLPPVGCEVKTKHGKSKVISTSEFDGGVVTYAYDNECSIACCWAISDWVKPLDGDSSDQPKHKHTKAEYVDNPEVGSMVMTRYTEPDCNVWCEFHGPSEVIAYHGDYVWVAHHGKFNKVHKLSDIEFKVETELTEQEIFIETCKKLRDEFLIQSDVDDFFVFIANSGKFKLVEGE